MSQFKTYVLLSSLDNTTPIYQRVSKDSRAKLDKLKSWRPYLKGTVQDETGRSVTLRYKETSRFIDQRQQIDEEKIDANVPFTSREREDPTFRNAYLTTNKPILQEYLEAWPECEGSKYSSPELTPKYKVLDENQEREIKNIETKFRVQSAGKVLGLNRDECVSLITKMMGVSYPVPKELDDCQTLIIEKFDEMEVDEINLILRANETIDEKVRTLVSKLIDEGAISFNEIEDQVAQKNDVGEWVPLKTIPSAYPMAERERQFMAFLTSPEGQVVYNALADSGSKKPKAKEK